VISDLITAGLKIIDKVIPDPGQRDAAKFKLLELEQAGQLAELKAETDLALEQIRVNAIEAASQDPFVRRWRPAFGWLGVAALAYAYIGHPILSWISPLAGTVSPPPVDTADLMVLVGGLLGFGGYRSWEKVAGSRDKA
jgi:hypothetical protein